MMLLQSRQCSLEARNRQRFYWHSATLPWGFAHDWRVSKKLGNWHLSNLPHTLWRKNGIKEVETICRAYTRSVFLNKNLKMNLGGEAILRVTGLHCGWGVQIHKSGTYWKTANPWTMDHSPSSSSWASYSSLSTSTEPQPWGALPPSLSFGSILLSEFRRC